MNTPVYVKDEIVDLIVYIYKNFELEKRDNIKGVINDLIGKYSESTKYHRAYAEYISVAAESALQKAKNTNIFKNISQLNTYLQKNFRHEHMTPKESIRTIFEHMAAKSQLTRKSVVDALDKCSKCAIITLAEDKLLAKKTHPDINNNGMVNLENFDHKRRYSEDSTKNGEKIELVMFDGNQFLKP